MRYFWTAPRIYIYIKFVPHREHFTFPSVRPVCECFIGEPWLLIVTIIRYTEMQYARRFHLLCLSPLSHTITTKQPKF